MLVWIFVIGLAIWNGWDANRRGESGVMWFVFSFLLAVVAVPIWFAKRPLLAGESREGGFGWNVLKNFALLWTAAMLLVAIVGMVGISGVAATATNEYEMAGAGLGAALGMGMIGAMWFFPCVGALVLGFFLKKNSIIERGPTVARA